MVTDAVPGTEAGACPPDVSTSGCRRRRSRGSAASEELGCAGGLEEEAEDGDAPTAPPPPAPPRRHSLRVTPDEDGLDELQTRCLAQERKDLKVFAVFVAVKACCYAFGALVLFGSFLFFLLSASGSSNLLYYVSFPLLAIVAGFLHRSQHSFTDAWSRWCDATSVNIVLRPTESRAEFKAVRLYLEACGMVTAHLRLQILQDEDDVEAVKLHYSPWAKSFEKRACIFGDTGEPASIEFRSFCLARCWCRSQKAAHGHFTVRYEKDENPPGDSLTLVVEDHQAEAIQNFIMEAHARYTTPKSTKIEVYSAAQVGDAASAPVPAWEFMQYICPLGSERTGRFTYVPSEAFFNIVEEYQRVVSIGNESLTVLVTGASRAGKSAMVTALAHRLHLPVYSLNLKARFLTNGGVEALFSHRSIPHRPVLVHIEEFSMMFQETVISSAERGDAEELQVTPSSYEGLQSSSALNCSDLLKLFDQSGTTSPKRIFFLLTCIEIPEHFGRIHELQPLVNHGRIQHFRLEEPNEATIRQYVLQHFFPETRRQNLSPEEQEALSQYMASMMERLGDDFTNWHAAKKHAEVVPLDKRSARPVSRA